MLCNNQVPSTKQNEKLIMAIVRYFNEMSSFPEMNDFFRKNMMPMFSLIVVPNISLTEDDVAEYEDEPETYIKNDLEESDTDTRKR
jgi:hypothetical protein